MFSLAAQELSQAKAATTLLSAKVKARQGKQLFDKQKDVATKLQALERKREGRKEFQDKKDTAIKVESLFRMQQEKKEFGKQKAAAIKLENVTRKHTAEAEYQKKREAAELLHNHVRRFLAMSKLEHKKMGLFSGKKRRMNSVLFKPLGDYIEARDNAHLIQILEKENPEDDHCEIDFADTVQKYNRKGKEQERQVVVTKKFCYFLDKNSVKSKYDLRQGEEIAGSSLSTMADNFVVIHLKNDRDLLLTCQHKTEFVITLGKNSGGEYAREDLPMKCADEFTFMTYGSGWGRSSETQEATVRFYEDEAVTEEEKWKLSIKGNTEFTVRVSPALCSNAKHPLGVPRAQQFKVMVGGRKKTAVTRGESARSEGSGGGGGLVGRMARGVSTAAGLKK